MSALGAIEATRDWLSAVGTLGAAVLAVAAIRETKKAGDRNAALIALERLLDFELDLLTEIADLVAQDAGMVMRSDKVKVRLGMLPDALPLCRKHFGLSTTPAAESQYDQLMTGIDGYNRDAQAKPALQHEIAAEAAERLARRH